MQSCPFMNVCIRSWLCVLGFATVACDSLSDDLAAARSRWQQHAVDDYSFVYRTTGFVAPIDARIVVADGAVTGVENRSSGVVLVPQTAPTIEVLFDAVEKAIDDGADTAVTWDPAFGFPVSANTTAGSETWGFEVSEFEPAS